MLVLKAAATKDNFGFVPNAHLSSSSSISFENFKLCIKSYYSGKYVSFTTRFKYAAAKCFGALCSFLLMLAVMTFNMFLIASILIGYFFAFYFNDQGIFENGSEESPLLSSAQAYSAESETLISSTAG